MEKWKIGVIAALLLSLIGFGVYKQGEETSVAAIQPTPAATPAALPYVGKTLPPWKFSQWNTGKGVSTESLKGKPAFVEVFRTGCSHCSEAMPMVVDMSKRYGARGLKVVGIQSPGDVKDASNPENDWKAVKTWLSERGAKHPIAFDEGSKYFQGTIKDTFWGGDGSRLLYPTMMLLDPSGKVIWAQTGHDTAKAVALAVELENLLPGQGSKEDRAKGLVKWLQSFDEFFDQLTDPAVAKALADDIATRLK